MNEMKYFECCCKSFDHSMRIWVVDDNDNYKLFTFEHQFQRFPTIRNWNIITFKPNQPIRNFFKNLLIWKLKIRNYFLCIWYAIKGKPYWWNACLELEIDQIKEMRDFFNTHLEEHNDNKTKQS